MARKANKKTGETANLGLVAKLWAAADASSSKSDYPASHSHANSELHRVAWSGQ
jgi:head-tail adaptor